MPERLKYGALGVLFVNVSIGGTLTSYAAPPVLMVAATWNWDSAFMARHLRLEGGARGAGQRHRHRLSCCAGTCADAAAPTADERARVPLAVTAIHLAFLVAAVVLSPTIR